MLLLLLLLLLLLEKKVKVRGRSSIREMRGGLRWRSLCLRGLGWVVVSILCVYRWNKRQQNGPFDRTIHQL
jgi:hypothetical protein